MIIVLSGVDGSGKSTVSELLANHLRKKKVKIKKLYLGDYFIIKYIIKLVHYIHNLAKPETSFKKTNKNPYLTTSNKPLYLKLWVIFTMIDNWVNFIRLKLCSIIGYTVLCDRYFYDKLIGFEYHGYSNTLLSKLYISLTPTPDFMFIFDVDEKTSLKRETNGNHTLSFYKNIRKRYKLIANRIDAIFLNVNDLSEQQVLNKIIKYINENKN